MKGFKFWTFFALVFSGFFVVTAGPVSAQGKGIPTENIKGAFRMVLSEADKNKDGKLSQDECLAMSKDPKKMEKNCKYWDANGDGLITEDEYVQQVKKIGKK